MKRTGHLYEKICDIENITLAIENASRGKRKRNIVKKSLKNKEAAAKEVRRILLEKAYEPAIYREKTIKDASNKKERKIFCPKFYPDQIIHWALMQVTQPIIMKGMYEFNCGCIPGRGVHYGKRYIERWLRRDKKNTKYCLKLDIEKYYPSINKEVLKHQFERKIKDKETLWLINKVIDSHSEGLPIGNYTSQWWANFYLQDLDHFIKEELRIKYYIRYMDDMVLLGSNKKKLHKARELIAKEIEPLGLKIKGNWQVFQINSRPLDFLGFKFHRTHTTLRKRNALKIKRRAKRITKRKQCEAPDARAMISYWGWIKHSNSYKFYKKNICPHIDIKKMKGVIRNESRKQNETRSSFG